MKIGWKIKLAFPTVVLLSMLLFQMCVMAKPGGQVVTAPSGIWVCENSEDHTVDVFRFELDGSFRYLAVAGILEQYESISMDDQLLDYYGTYQYGMLDQQGYLTCHIVFNDGECEDGIDEEDNTEIDEMDIRIQYVDDGILRINTVGDADTWNTYYQGEELADGRIRVLPSLDDTLRDIDKTPEDKMDERQEEAMKRLFSSMKSFHSVEGQPTKFCCIDLDGDGWDEVIIRTYTSEGMEGGRYKYQTCAYDPDMDDFWITEEDFMSYAYDAVSYNEETREIAVNWVFADQPDYVVYSFTDKCITFVRETEEDLSFFTKLEFLEMNGALEYKKGMQDITG